MLLYLHGRMKLNNTYSVNCLHWSRDNFEKNGDLNIQIVTFLKTLYTVFILWQ